MNSTSKILLNGNLSEKIILGGGAGRLIPYHPICLFFATEFLAEAFGTNKKIEGIVVLKQEHKISQYADDTSLFLKTQKIISSEGEHSHPHRVSVNLRVKGQINTEKTKVIEIRNWWYSRTTFCQDMKLEIMLRNYLRYCKI